MNAEENKALWKQILDRLTLTKDDLALFKGQDVLSLTVTTARPLTEEDVPLLEQLLKEKMTVPVRIDKQLVDSKMVGGVLIRWGDHIFDATMKRQLEKMDAIMRSCESPTKSWIIRKM